MLLSEAGLLYNKIVDELTMGMEKMRNDNDDDTLSIKNTMIPELADMAMQLRSDRKDILKEINLLVYSDAEWADESLKQFSDIIDSVNTFRLNVNRIVTDKQLDRPSQVNKLMTELKVEKFCGWAESQVVHEFVKQIRALFSMASLNKDKDKALRKDFKVAQYIYVALYTALVISLIIISI